MEMKLVISLVIACLLTVVCSAEGNNCFIAMVCEEGGLTQPRWGKYNPSCNSCQDKCDGTVEKIKNLSGTAENNISMMKNITAQIDDLVSQNAEQSGKNSNYERRISEQEVKNSEQAKKIAEQVERIRQLENYVRKIRLVNGSSIKSGRIEVLQNGTWGTVCDDLWWGTTGKHNADVACRQLGFSSSTWFEVDDSSGGFYNSQTYGAGTGQIWLDDVNCTGSENTLSNCAHREWGSHSCKHTEDIAVVCE